MKTCFHAFAMAQSMFCYIPSPFRVWDEEARPKMMLFLPVVGLEIGLGWYALAWLCGLLRLPALIAGLVLCVCQQQFGWLKLSANADAVIVQAYPVAVQLTDVLVVFVLVVAVGLVTSLVTSLMMRHRLSA